MGIVYSVFVNYTVTFGVEMEKLKDEVAISTNLKKYCEQTVHFQEVMK